MAVVPRVMTGSGEPDWGAVSCRVPCPRCGYDLRMLPQPRCPECGLTFVWETVIAAALRPRGPLFEYQWNKRPLRSLLRTLGSALWPPWLWRQTALESSPRIGPLLLLLALALLLYLVCVNVVEEFWQFFAWQSGFIDWYLPARILDARDRTLVLLVPAVAVWLMLQVFRQTIGRYRIRQDQLFRLVVLAWVVLLAWKTLFVVADGALTIVIFRRPFLWEFGEWFDIIADVLPLVALVVALSVGLGGHLRIRRGRAMGVLVVVAALFALVCVYILLMVQWFGRTDNYLARVIEGEWRWLYGQFIELLLRVGTRI